MTDLFVNHTNTYQYLDPSFCHPYHCKKGIPYSQALSLIRIWSYNKRFDKRRNDFEGSLMERTYNGKMMRKHLLGTEKRSRKHLFEREKSETSEPKLMFNTTYYTVFQSIRNIS